MQKNYTPVFFKINDCKIHKAYNYGYSFARENMSRSWVNLACVGPVVRCQVDNLRHMTLEAEWEGRGHAKVIRHNNIFMTLWYKVCNHGTMWLNICHIIQ